MKKGHVSSDEAQGSRFNSLATMEDSGIHEEVKQSCEGGEVPGEGTLVVYVDQENEKGPQGPRSPKVRHGIGGKSSQMGPRVGDAKQAARSNGPLKKGQLAMGGIGQPNMLLKENIHPSVPVVGTGSGLKVDRGPCCNQSCNPSPRQTRCCNPLHLREKGRGVRILCLCKTLALLRGD